MLEAGGRIGILGGGQLGRMLALAATELGFKTHIFCPENESCATEVATTHTMAEYNDETALKKFASAVDVISFEFENIPISCANFLSSQNKSFFPPSLALTMTQNRLVEKKFLNDLGIETAEWFYSNDDLKKITSPVLIKTSQFGYDGKGQIIANDLTEIKSAIKTLRTECIIEKKILFDREIAICGVRSFEGEMIFYPPVQTFHQAGILRRATAPAVIDKNLSQAGFEIIKTIANTLNYTGVIVVEFFQINDRLIVNEIAPRVHNSYHWTIEGAATSQFAQHIRAITRMPFGDINPIKKSIMTNIIGDDDYKDFSNLPDTIIHLYNKGETKPQRKMGHITQVFPS